MQDVAETKIFFLLKDLIISTELSANVLFTEMDALSIGHTQLHKSGLN